VASISSVVPSGTVKRHGCDVVAFRRCTRLSKHNRLLLGPLALDVSLLALALVEWCGLWRWCGLEWRQPHCNVGVCGCSERQLRVLAIELREVRGKGLK